MLQTHGIFVIVNMELLYSMSESVKSCYSRLICMVMLLKELLLASSDLTPPITPS